MGKCKNIHRVYSRYEKIKLYRIENNTTNIIKKKKWIIYLYTDKFLEL